MRLKKERRVVITGVGPLTSIGAGKEELWKSILNKKQGRSYERFYFGKDCLGSIFLSKIKNFDINKYNIDPEILNEIYIWKKERKSTDLNYFLSMIKLALDDSKYDIGNGLKTGVILTHEQPGGERFFLEFLKKSFNFMNNKKGIARKDYFKLMNNAFSRDVYDQQTFMFLFHVGKAFGIHGYSLFINNACASGLYAIEAASQLIKSNKLDTVVVAAADNPSLFRSLWIKENRLYSTDGIIRPFSLNRNGFICGQGGSALILEDFEHAKRRKAKIYAEYIGGRFILESWKVTLPNVLEDHYYNMIKEVLEENHVLPKDIDLVNAHGVATRLGDQYEAKAINRVFKTKNRNIMVNALKPYVGHTLGASGLLEIVILIIAMDKGLLIPTLNVDPIDEELKLNIVTRFMKIQIETILKLSCGFGGFDGAVIIKRI